jgi:hypothetical protein
MPSLSRYRATSLRRIGLTIVKDDLNSDSAVCSIEKGGREPFRRGAGRSKFHFRFNDRISHLESVRQAHALNR